MGGARRYPSTPAHMAMGIASRPPSYGLRATASSSGMTRRNSSANLASKARHKGQKCPGRTAVHKGRVVFGAMDEVVFGRPASEAIVEQLNRLDAKRAFLMVSGTLNRETAEIENIRRVLGPRCVGTFDAMPPHTPRAAVIAASELARAANADLIVTIGGGSITDGAKAVQLCLANDIRDPDDIDRIRAGRGASPQLTAPTVRQISVPTLPSVMRWNKSANAERQALVAAAMGHPNEDAGDVLDAFIRGLAMPRSLREVKVAPEHFDRIAQAAMATPWVPRNPRKIEGPAQVREILDMAA